MRVGGGGAGPARGRPGRSRRRGRRPTGGSTCGCRPDATTSPGRRRSTRSTRCPRRHRAGRRPASTLRPAARATPTSSARWG